MTRCERCSYWWPDHCEIMQPYYPDGEGCGRYEREPGVEGKKKRPRRGVPAQETNPAIQTRLTLDEQIMAAALGFGNGFGK